jgi:hypothetical protein
MFLPAERAWCKLHGQFRVPKPERRDAEALAMK